MTNCAFHSVKGRFHFKTVHLIVWYKLLLLPFTVLYKYFYVFSETWCTFYSVLAVCMCCINVQVIWYKESVYSVTCRHGFTLVTERDRERQQCVSVFILHKPAMGLRSSHLVSKLLGTALNRIFWLADDSTVQQANAKANCDITSPHGGPERGSLQDLFFLCLCSVSCWQDQGMLIKDWATFLSSTASQHLLVWNQPTFGTRIKVILLNDAKCSQ